MPRPRRAALPAVAAAARDVVGHGRDHRDGDDDAVSAECRKLLATLQRRCPGLLIDGKTHTAGEVGPEIPIDRERGSTLFRLVARRVAGLPTENRDDPGVVVWTQGADELAVMVDKVSVTTGDGAVAVDIPVRCDEVGDTEIRVRFAVGSEKRPAGMLATTDERPFGPHEVIDVWGEALTSFAWQIVLRSTAGVADATGRDADGAGLIPIALRATDDGVTVHTMARHTFDRVVTP